MLVVSYKSFAASGTARALKAMNDVKSLNKTSEVVDTLMVPTLGSQEGAFENVKANFGGEQVCKENILVVLALFELILSGKLI